MASHSICDTTRYSASGIMKARWAFEDYSAMQSDELTWEAEDVELIHLGLQSRPARLRLSAAVPGGD